jgi:hypothetical protein
VAPGNSVELAEAMIRVSKDSGLREYLGVNARKKILVDFNLDTNVAKIKNLFDAV